MISLKSDAIIGDKVKVVKNGKTYYRARPGKGKQRTGISGDDKIGIGAGIAASVLGIGGAIAGGLLLTKKAKGSRASLPNDTISDQEWDEFAKSRGESVDDFLNDKEAKTYPKKQQKAASWTDINTDPKQGWEQLGSVLLGVPVDADKATVKSAYQKMMALYHPDKNSSPEAKEMTAKANAAYEWYKAHRLDSLIQLYFDAIIGNKQRSKKRVG